MPRGFYALMVGILCTWRITHLFVYEDGPWDVFTALRRRTGSGFWGKLLGCFYCLSLWVAAPLAILLGRGWVEIVCLALAISGGAVLLERATSRESEAAPAPFFEHSNGDQHAVLRTESIAADGQRSQSQD